MTQIPMKFSVEQSKDTIERLDFYLDGKKPGLTLFFAEGENSRVMNLTAGAFYQVICALKGKADDSITVTWSVGEDRGTLLTYTLAAGDPSVRELPGGELLGVASFNFTLEAKFALQEA